VGVRSMMSIAARGLPHRMMTVLVVAGVGVAF
jgi:hypothetical protein